MGFWKKGESAGMEPQWYQSATNLPTYNYNVYYMTALEKLLYFLGAFAVGAAVGYLFYGGIGKDSLGRRTAITWVLDITVSAGMGLLTGFAFLPIRTRQILDKRKRLLNAQFRDFLEAIDTSLGAGKNVPEAFRTVEEDLKLQYEEEAFIRRELEVILSGMGNNVAVEELLLDFGRRSGNEDILSFAGVFQICYRKGGNIKETIRNTHEILSDKMQIQEDIETIVTANRMEQRIMIAMPIALIGAIKLMSPDFAVKFVSSSGVIATTIAIVLFVVSYFVGRAILDIKF